MEYTKGYVRWSRWTLNPSGWRPMHSINGNVSFEPAPEGTLSPSMAAIHSPLGSRWASMW